MAGDFGTAMRLGIHAGAPLITPTGESLGALCVIDREPRQLTAQQLDGLATLSREVMTQLELRSDLVLLRRKIEQDQTPGWTSALPTPSLLCVSGYG